MNDIYDEIAKASKCITGAAVCTIVETKGSAPRKAGAKMLVFEDGTIKGSIGGGSLEKLVITQALECIRTNKPSIEKHDLLHQHSMCCGGTVEIFIEPVMKTSRLFIFGAGHTGLALAHFASTSGFEVFLIDDRKDFIDMCDEPAINKMHLGHLEAMQAVQFDEYTYIVITTYSHQIDRDILAFCSSRKWAYLGMIGSRRKVETTKKMFIQSGIGTKEELDKIHMPIGLDINAHTPEEIAVSILAELIKVKNEGAQNG